MFYNNSMNLFQYLLHLTGVGIGELWRNAYIVVHNKVSIRELYLHKLDLYDSPEIEYQVLDLYLPNRNEQNPIKKKGTIEKVFVSGLRYQRLWYIGEKNETPWWNSLF